MVLLFLFPGNPGWRSVPRLTRPSCLRGWASWSLESDGCYSLASLLGSHCEEEIKKFRIFKNVFFFVQAEWMCADICANPEDTTMTCDDCKMGIQVYLADMADMQ